MCIVCGGNVLLMFLFMIDGCLMVLSGNKFIVIDLFNGICEELLSWEFSDEFKVVELFKDYIVE